MTAERTTAAADLELGPNNCAVSTPETDGTGVDAV